jgi:hypothetical protein
MVVIRIQIGENIIDDVFFDGKSWVNIIIK